MRCSPGVWYSIVIVIDSVMLSVWESCVLVALFFFVFFFFILINCEASFPTCIALPLSLSLCVPVGDGVHTWNSLYGGGHLQPVRYGDRLKLLGLGEKKHSDQ